MIFLERRIQSHSSEFRLSPCRLQIQFFFCEKIAGAPLSFKEQQAGSHSSTYCFRFQGRVYCQSLRLFLSFVCIAIWTWSPHILNQQHFLWQICVSGIGIQILNTTRKTVKVGSFPPTSKRKWFARFGLRIAEWQHGSSRANQPRKMVFFYAKFLITGHQTNSLLRTKSQSQ